MGLNSGLVNGSVEGNTTTGRASFTAQGAAGTYTAYIPVPIGFSTRRIVAETDTEWTAGTSAVLNVGIAGGDTDAFLASVDLKTTPLADSSASACSTDLARKPVPRATCEWIVATVVTTGTTSTTGSTTVYAEFVPDSLAVTASYAAT